MTVPKGSTAYQAWHSFLYYGRSEFAANPLPDNVIRLLMERGRVPQARVALYSCKLLTALQELAGRKAELEHIDNFRMRAKLEYLRAPQRDFDEYEVQLAVENVGEVTLRDFLLRLVCVSDFPVFEKDTNPSNIWTTRRLQIECGKTMRYRFATGVETTTTETRQYTPTEQKLFPSERIQFPERSWLVHVPAGEVVQECVAEVGWTIFLDDAPPVSGHLDVEDCRV